MLYPAIVGRKLSRAVKPTFIVVGVGINDNVTSDIRGSLDILYAGVDYLDIIDVRSLFTPNDRSHIKRIHKEEMVKRWRSKTFLDFVNCKLHQKGKTLKFAFSSDVSESMTVFKSNRFTEPSTAVCGTRGIDIHVISSFTITVTDIDCELYGFDARLIGKKTTMLSLYNPNSGLSFIPETDFISMANNRLLNPLNVKLSNGKVVGKGFELPSYNTKVV